MAITFEELIHRDADSALRHRIDRAWMAFYGQLREICDVSGSTNAAEVDGALLHVHKFCAESASRLHSLLRDANRDDAVRAFYLTAKAARPGSN